MNTGASERTVMGVAGSSDGDVAVLFAEDEYVSPLEEIDEIFENALVLATRKGGGDWVMQRLFQDRAGGSAGALDQPILGFMPSSVAFFAGMAFVATIQYQGNSSGNCDTRGFWPCGLFGQFVALDGKLNGTETIDDNVRRVVWVSLVEGDGGALYVAYAGTPKGGSDMQLLLSSRDPVTGKWSTPTTLAPTALSAAPEVIRPPFVDGVAVGWRPGWSPAVAITAEGPTVFYRNAQSQLEVWHAGGSELITNLPVPPDSTTGSQCLIDGPMQATAFPDTSGQAVRFYGWCRNPDTGKDPISIVGTWRPWLASGQRFTVETAIGQFWQTGADDPPFFVPLVPEGLPMVYAESPPAHTTSPPITNSDVRLIWDDASGFHQFVAYHPPGDSVIASFGASVVGKTRPVVALTLSPIFCTATTGPALVVLDFH
jgi:hypothetical protein